MNEMHNNEQTMTTVQSVLAIAAVQQEIQTTSAATAPAEQPVIPQTITISTMQLMLVVGLLTIALLLFWVRRRWMHRQQNHARSSVTELYGVEHQPQRGQPDVRGNLRQFDTFRPLPHWNHATVQDVHVQDVHVRDENVREDKEDTSKLLPAPQFQFDSQFEFDDEATQLVSAKSNHQILGHLIRIISDPRIPAELTLYGAASLFADEQTIGIGRHSKYNAVVIQDKSVSRQHAVLIQRGEQLWIRDNQSTTGTLLNWRRLQSDVAVPLQDQDIVSFGEAVYEFRLQLEDTDHLFAPVTPIVVHGP